MTCQCGGCGWGRAHDCGGLAVAAADVDDDVVGLYAGASDVAEGVCGLAQDDDAAVWSAAAVKGRGGCRCGLRRRGGVEVDGARKDGR